MRDLLRAPANVDYVSVASAWELEIKRALGKLDTPDDLEARIAAARFTELPVALSHVRALRSLPPLHRDPFDRILVAQAIAERLTIVSRDERIAQYPVKVIVP